MSVHNSSTELDFDRAVEVGSAHADAALAQRLQHLSVRVPEEVVPAARNDRQMRTDGVEEGGSGGCAAAVMGDFQDVRAQVAIDQLPFRLALDVAGEQDPPPLDLHAQDDRRVVFG